jgi:two-component system LytT family response regulator
VEHIEKIRTVIIDDNKEFIFHLKEHLSFFPEIVLVGEADKYEKAKRLITFERPDLVFLDIEMPYKNGFELLQEVRAGGCNFTVIFCTAYDKYILQALRESALDYILKPIDHEELKEAITRYKDKQRTKLSEIPVSRFQHLPGLPEMAALPTGTGIKFIDKSCIIAFQYKRESIRKKPAWTVVLNDFSEFRLRTGITAKEICDIMDPRRFILINQSVIVNLSYLAAIEFKSRNCILIPPYNEFKFTVSRSQLAELRDKFDLM